MKGGEAKQRIRIAQDNDLRYFKSIDETLGSSLFLISVGRATPTDIIFRQASFMFWKKLKALRWLRGRHCIWFLYFIAI
jgi:hypothetical protein